MAAEVQNPKSAKIAQKKEPFCVFYIVGVYYPMLSISQFKSMRYIGVNTAKQNEQRHAMVHEYIWYI